MRRADVPGPVLQACEVLRGAGHEAVVVGGAVRDVLLGQAAGDFDVATSATPDQVTKLFRKVIPTGVEHGTVTVRLGGHSIEVTAFRGEGAYSDARRPDEVRFGVPLTEDLARRDFTVNAIAFDPVDERLVDPFGGAADLAAGVLRAVGDPTERFREDGLRVMRAVRFVARLELALDAATEAAIPAALSSLARVSAERVHDELVKLLAAREPSRGLDVARRTGVLGVVLPEVAARESFAAVDATPGSTVPRLAALLWGSTDGDAADVVLRRLKFSNQEREQVVAILRRGDFDASTPRNDADVRRLLRAVGRNLFTDVLAVRRGRAAAGEEPTAPLDSLAVAAAARLGDPIEVKDLAVNGRDVIAALGGQGGPIVGRILDALIDRVIDDPTLNDRDRLLSLIPGVTH